MSLRLTAGVLHALMLVASAFAGAGVTAAGAPCPPQPQDRTTHGVARVIDGQTLLLDDGREVRLAGVLAPQKPLAADPATAWPPEEDAIRALNELVLGRSVALVPAGQDRNRYGQLIRHAIVERDGQSFWIQGEMIARGHGRAYALERQNPCLAALVAIEQEARSQRLGLWRSAAYGLRKAEDTRELMRLRSTFQVVEGRVVRVAEVRGTIYLNFGEDWRTDFSAGYRPDRKQMGAVADARRIEGHRVRVRGWIERRNGPFIAIADWASLEVLEAAPAWAPGARSAN